MRPLTLIPLIAALVAQAIAVVKFTSPAAGATVKAGTISIAWEDSGESPSLALLTTYDIQLIQGGNDGDNSVPLTVLSAKGSHAAGTKAQGVIPVGISGELKNGFYLKMQSIAKEGGQVINYSDRFSVTGLTGTSPAKAVEGAKAVTGTAGPATQNQIANNAAAGIAADGGLFDVAYADQTGLTKYAPMQGIPPTKITIKNFTPMHPTSSCSIATTWLPKPSIQTTITQTQTFSVSSMENTAAAQAGPSGDMQKFLNRWKD